MNNGRLQIFLAEDNGADVNLVREALREHSVDCDLTVARDGTSASRYINDVAAGKNPCPDLFLLDLNLPQSDGHELFALIRESAACAHTPVVILTSSDAPRDRERAKALGVSVYFRKPSDLLEFFELGNIVRKLVEQDRQR